MRENNKKENKPRFVKEPEAAYQAKSKIKFFNSFEEAEKDHIKDVLQELPLQRLKNAIDLILRAYQTSREDLKNKIHSNKISIVSTS